MPLAATVQLAYALSFVVLGTAILAQPRRSRFEIGGILWLLAVYALVHAAGDFVELLEIARGAPKGAGYYTGQAAAFIAFGFLFEFGRRLWGLTSPTLPGWALPLLIAAVAGASAASSEPWPVAHVLAGYLVRAPAGVLGGVGLLRYWQRHRSELGPIGVGRFFVAGAAAMLLWAFLCGVVREPASFFPADWLNARTVQDLTGVPVQAFRTACAIVATWALTGVLRIFHWEAVRQHALAAAERARREIAMELHDGVGATLAAGHVATQLAARKMSGCKASGQCAEAVEGIERTLRDGLVDMRASLWSLDERDASWEHFLARLRRHVREAASAAGLEATFDTRGSAPEAASPRLRLAVYRVAQEALTNAIRHARARSFRCEIELGASHVSVLLEDDGAGMATDAPKGRGLANIERRVRDLDGRVEIGPGANGGTRVSAIFAVTKLSEDAVIA